MSPVVRAVVGEGATLRWLPEASVAASGCRHEVQAQLVLAPGSRVVWREELLLGRPAWSGSRAVIPAPGGPGVGRWRAAGRAIQPDVEPAYG